MATNFFMNITGPAVTGEATDSQHTDDIQVLSWSHSFNQPTSPTRASAGAATVEQANHAEFSFSKYTDSATDDLLKLCWQGDQIDKCTFFAYRADGGGHVGFPHGALPCHVRAMPQAVGQWLIDQLR